jgi:hypothetical protein
MKARHAKELDDLMKAPVSTNDEKDNDNDVEATTASMASLNVDDAPKQEEKRKGPSKAFQKKVYPSLPITSTSYPTIY